MLDMEAVAVALGPPLMPKKRLPRPADERDDQVVPGLAGLVAGIQHDEIGLFMNGLAVAPPAGLRDLPLGHI